MRLQTPDFSKCPAMGDLTATQPCFADWSFDYDHEKITNFKGGPMVIISDEFITLSDSVSRAVYVCETLHHVITVVGKPHSTLNTPIIELTADFEKRLSDRMKCRFAKDSNTVNSRLQEQRVIGVVNPECFLAIYNAASKDTATFFNAMLKTTIVYEAVLRLLPSWVEYSEPQVSG